jgi:hypothetical protein
MKRHVFSPLLLLLCVTTVASAQSPAPTADAPTGVSVLKYNWRNMTYRPGWDDPSSSAASQGVEDLRTLPSQDLGTSRTATPLGVAARRPRERSSEATTAPQGRPTEITASPPSGPSSRREQYNYQAQIRNDGEGTIEAVDWEYVFLDASTGDELARHRFQTFRRARPGKSLTLVGTSVAPPSRVVSAASQGGKRGAFAERIVVKCVAYADGTMRRRAGGAENDCDAISAAAQTRRP